MFRYDWSRFNIKMGLIFMVGTVLAFSPMALGGLDTFVAAISALLAWFPIILIRDLTWRRHLVGLGVMLIGGLGLTALAGFLMTHDWVFLGSMAVITFCGYLMLLRGPHPYLVAWCLVYYYLLAPVFLRTTPLEVVAVSFTTGVGLVMFLNIWKPLWRLATRQGARSQAVDGPSASGSETAPSPGLVVSFASVVSLSIVAGLLAGVRFMTTDPTVVANATLNMISPSFKQTLQAGIERLVVGVAGLLGGFYTGWFFPDPAVGLIVTIVCSFMGFATLYVNFGLVVGFIFFLIAYPWGTMRSDIAHQIGNEKLIGEFMGVAIAIVAVAILSRLRNHKAANVN